MDVDSSFIPARSRKHPLVRVAIEVLAVVVAVFFAIIAVGHIAQTEWASTFLYNGDSLALPLIQQSIERGYPFLWVFSSQDYLFPEGPIYFVSAIFSNSYRTAMYVNGCLNVVLLYALLRVIARQLANHARHRFVEITVALGTTGLFVIFVLLEPTASVNSSGVATPFLFSSYYDGVTLSGLTTVALTLWLTRAFGPAPWSRSRVVRYDVFIVVLTMLTSFSDPLYLLQVVVPLAGAVTLLVLLRRLTWRSLVVLAIPTAVGALLAIGFRILFRKWFAGSPGGYIDFSQIPSSLHLLTSTIAGLGVTPEGVLTILLLGGALLVNGIIFILALYARVHPRFAVGIPNSDVFVVSFVSVSVVSLLAGMVLTGSPTTRYLQPVFIFPLVTFVSLGIRGFRRLLVGVKSVELRRSLSRFALALAAIAAALVIVVGSVTIPSVARSASGVGYSGAQCFDRFVGDAKVNGVGSYWTVRSLALYGTSKGVILQADNVLGPMVAFAWIVNLAPYKDKKFSYVVADSSPMVRPAALVTLGKPRQTVKCPGYVIYDYRGTKGETVLTREIAESADQELESRFGQ